MSADLFANCNAGNPGNSRWDAGEGPGIAQHIVEMQSMRHVTSMKSNSCRPAAMLLHSNRDQPTGEIVEAFLNLQPGKGNPMALLLTSACLGISVDCINSLDKDWKYRCYQLACNNGAPTREMVFVWSDPKELPHPELLAIANRLKADPTLYQSPGRGVYLHMEVTNRIAPKKEDPSETTNFPNYRLIKILDPKDPADAALIANGFPGLKAAAVAPQPVFSTPVAVPAVQVPPVQVQAPAVPPVQVQAPAVPPVQVQAEDRDVEFTLDNFKAFQAGIPAPTGFKYPAAWRA